MLDSDTRFITSIENIDTLISLFRQEKKELREAKK